MTVLGEIENILDNEEFDDCIWQGDLNWHRGRNTGFAATMERFVTRLGLISTWQEFPCDFTHIHTDLKSVSTLDHFLVNERLLPFIKSSGPIHLGDNLSRHSPVFLKLEVKDIPKMAPVNLSRPKRPIWYKARQVQLDQYTNDLNNKIERLVQPDCLNCQDVNCQLEGHTTDRDSYVLDLMTVIIETSHQNIPMSSDKRREPDPDKNCPVNHNIPGWRETIQPLRDKSLFWHQVWVSAGRPNAGVLRDIMANTMVPGINTISPLGGPRRCRKISGPGN